MAPVAAKAGVLLAIAAAGSTSVWYFSDSIFGSPLVSIADETPSSNYGNTSIGKNYSRYFLSSKNKNNKKVWEKRFDDNKAKFAGTGTENENTKAKDKFGTVTTPYGNENTALNKVCEESYKLTDNTKLVTEEPSSNGTDKFTSSNIWKFCSIGGIVTVSEDGDNYKSQTFTTSKIGGDETSKKVLVSAKKEENNWFWKIRDEEFKAESGERSKTKVKGSGTNNSIKKLKDGDESIKTISEACHSAYGQETSDDSNKTKEDAELFCSIKLTIPTTPATQ